MSTANSVSIAAVRTFLQRSFPLDGLRKAAERIGAVSGTTKDDYVNALVAALEAAPDGHLPRVPGTLIKSGPIWDASVAAGTPFSVTDWPLVVVDVKRELALKLDAYLSAATEGGKTVAAISAGKVSSCAVKAERAAYKQRWCSRYGKPKHAFTLMRRLYADTSAGTNYKEREEFALTLEEHVFQLLRRRYDSTVVAFSPEAGRKNTGVSFGPGWGVFVYLAIKLAD